MLLEKCHKVIYKVKRQIKVFIVDDSAVIRQTFSQFLNNSSDPEILVVGTAPNGKIALEKLRLERYRPDVVLMDILMPEMDGFETIGHIFDSHPLPVIIVSNLKKKEVRAALSNLGMTAFETGAVEFIKKPVINNIQEFNNFKRELIRLIKNMADVDVSKSYLGFDFRSYISDIKEMETKPIPTVQLEAAQIPKAEEKLIVIGASTGGPRAISLLLSKIKKRSPPILIVQHMPTEMVKPWCARLNRLYTELDIAVPKNGTQLKKDHIYIAPGGKHCVVNERKRIELVEGEKVNFVIPSIDVTLKSASKVYRENLLVIILTGMGKDGMDGAKSVKKYGGTVLVEDESTTVIKAMPRAVVEAKSADLVVPLHKIPQVMKKHNWII